MRARFADIAWRKSSQSTENGSCVEVGTWRKSSYSDEHGACVEVAPSIMLIAVRDSKDPDGARLAFSRREWAAFAARVKAGF